MDMAVEFREEPCRSALNRVQGMPFKWSLNPYMGGAHRCTFCYVRGFERRADRPSGEAYGRSVRVKLNVADVLRRELARKSWKREVVAIGAATDPYQPAEGRYRLTRACLEVFAEARSPFSIITRGPMILRDLDVLRRAATRADVHVTFSIPTLDAEIWRRTEPGTAPPRQRLRVLRMLIDAGIDAGVGIAPVLPGLSDRHPELLAPTWYVPRRTPAPPTSGATSCTCSPARASTSWSIWRATGRSWCRATWPSIAGRIPTAPGRWYRGPPPSSWRSPFGYVSRASH